MADNTLTDNQKITVITTHINADFDAVASLLAAQKLYPDSVVVFPGSQEKKLRDFFVSSMAYLFRMADISTIDMNSVSRIVLVDTAQPSRIGAFSEICKKENIEIHIFDHHPVAEGDIRADEGIRETAGATVTLLVEKIRESGIPLSPEEATILCLGIYEDTGSFSFASTTERDFLAAAFLLSQGASLNTISDIIAREINPFQLSVLNDMIQSAEKRRINGIEIVITKVSSERYINDLAYLTHKMVKMESINVIFTIAQLDNKVQIIARSRIPEVNVAFILSFFGGGGHAYAASATVKNTTQTDIEIQLADILLKNIRSSKTARALMSSPAIKTTPDVTCEDAAVILTRYNVNALVIIEYEEGTEKLSGFITRQVIDKAISHGLAHLSVREYMNPEIVSVDPDADLSEIHSKIIASNQRILPVVENGLVTGVVTRTDLIKTLEEFSEPVSETGQEYDPKSIPKIKNLSAFMKERLPAHIIDLLAEAGKVASETGYSIYVVGGFVRDLLLYEKNLDIDLVVEGDGILFAKKFGELHNAHVHTYIKFGTAVITMPDGFKVDVASARLEYYQHPGALPTVEKSSIKLDMYRRDFTINTLAIQLNPGKFGTLLDFFSGQKDIKDRVIRVIHNLSFVEDPTRIFRAIRFEQRFGFTIGKLAASLIQKVLVANQQAGLTYTWYNNTVVIGSNNDSLTVTQAGNYQLFVSDGVCDSLSDNYPVIVNTLPIVSVNNASACINSAAVQLTATGAQTYVWTSGTNPSSGDVVTVSTSVAGVTNYTVTGTDLNGCKDTSVATVTINANPIITINGLQNGNITLCNGIDTTLTAAGANTYVWSTLETTNPINYNTTSASTVTVVGTDLNGCVDSTNITTTVAPGPVIGSGYGVPTICNGYATQLSIDSTAGYTYSWTNSVGTVLSTDTIVTIATAGNYTLTVSNSCGSTNQAITIGSASIDVSFDADTTMGLAPLHVQFTNTSSGATNYYWLFGNGDTLATTTFNPTADLHQHFEDAGTYTVYLLGTNNTNYCSQSYTMEIIVLAQDIGVVVPNVFSPNGDATNDFFGVQSYGIETFTCTIFNRWGNLIAELDNVNEKWTPDASVSEGTYFYIIKAKGIDKKDYSREGYLLLVR